MQTVPQVDEYKILDLNSARELLRETGQSDLSIQIRSIFLFLLLLLLLSIFYKILSIFFRSFSRLASHSSFDPQNEVGGIVSKCS